MKNQRRGSYCDVLILWHFMCCVVSTASLLNRDFPSFSCCQGSCYGHNWKYLDFHEKTSGPSSGLREAGPAQGINFRRWFFLNPCVCGCREPWVHAQKVNQSWVDSSPPRLQTNLFNTAIAAPSFSQEQYNEINEPLMASISDTSVPMGSCGSVTAPLLLYGGRAQGCSFCKML